MWGRGICDEILAFTSFLSVSQIFSTVNSPCVHPGLNIMMESGELREFRELQCPGETTIGEIRDFLAAEEMTSPTCLKIFKQVQELDNTKTIRAGETLTVFKEERVVETEDTPIHYIPILVIVSSVSPKNIENETDDEIIVVVLNRKREPIFIPDRYVKAVRFDNFNWSNKLELYR